MSVFVKYDPRLYMVARSIPAHTALCTTAFRLGQDSVFCIAPRFTVREKYPDGREISRIRPDRPWGPATLLYSENRVSLPGEERLGRDVDNQTLSSAEVKVRVYLYLYPSSGRS